MKSEKASACLEKCAIQSKDPYIGRYVLYHEAAICMDIAEEEAEKRVRDDLTRWHDPKEELPEPMKDVLVKCSSKTCTVDFYEPQLGCFFGEHATYMRVIGWRYIHE